MILITSCRTSCLRHLDYRHIVLDIVYDICPAREQNFNWYQSRHPNLLGELLGDIFCSKWTREDQSTDHQFWMDQIMTIGKQE